VNSRRGAGNCALALVLAVLAGCASGAREPVRYFVLDVAVAPVAASQPLRRETLLITPTTSATFYDTQDIMVSRQPGVRTPYQFSHWTEPPSAAVHAALTDRIEASHLFRDVTTSSRRMPGTLALDTSIREIYHDASSNPGTATIVLYAELREPVKHELVARRVFHAEAAASSFDAPGAVAGLRAALTKLSIDLVDWLRSMP